MQGLIGLYLVTSWIQYLPVIIIIWSLKYGLPSSLLPTNPGNGILFSYKLQNIGIAKFERLFPLFDLNIKDRSVKYAFAACVFQIIGMFIIMLAIALGKPLSFIPEIEGVSYMGLMYDLFVFAAATNFIHLIPLIGLILVLIYRIPLPFAAALNLDRAQLRDELTRWEENSEGFAWIRLTRFENLEKTFIYAYCREERRGNDFKLVLCQGKKAGDRPQCFLYTEDESMLEQINPAPVSVNELDEIFFPDDDDDDDDNDNDHDDDDDDNNDDNNDDNDDDDEVTV